jgi:diaminopimelate decarboxylase
MGCDPDAAVMARALNIPPALHLIRPTLYEAHHEIRPVREPRADAARNIADVAGPVCESGDLLALERDIVEPQPGDLLAAMTAGAYGAVQAGAYNTRALVSFARWQACGGMLILADSLCWRWA